MFAILHAAYFIPSTIYLLKVIHYTAKNLLADSWIKRGITLFKNFYPLGILTMETDQSLHLIETHSQ